MFVSHTTFFRPIVVSDMANAQPGTTAICHRIFVGNNEEKYKYLSSVAKEYTTTSSKSKLTKSVDFQKLLDTSQLIHLPRDTKRLENIKLTFKYHGLQFPNIFNGMEEKEDAPNALTKSHMEVLKYAQQHNLPYILVYEDNAYPCNNIVDILKDLLIDVPSDADVVQLSWSLNHNKHD